MIVSDQSLKRLLAEGTIVVEPLEERQIQPASIDLRLGDHFLKVDENSMEAIALDRELEYIEFKQEEIIIPPHSFLLAVTRETIRLPENITAFVEGRSSIGRIGLFIERRLGRSRFFRNHHPGAVQRQPPAHPSDQRPTDLSDRLRLHGRPGGQPLQGQVPEPAGGGRKPRLSGSGLGVVILV